MDSPRFAATSRWVISAIKSSSIVGPAFSGFYGMAGATILGNMVEDRFDGPPSMVTFLPSFWFLVPGVLGLLGVKRLLTGQATIDCLFTVVFTFTSIALVGESLYKLLAKMHK